LKNFLVVDVEALVLALDEEFFFLFKLGEDWWFTVTNFEEALLLEFWLWFEVSAWLIEPQLEILLIKVELTLYTGFC
jgi:hypothetical protein